jgi:hypothetical protein
VARTAQTIGTIGLGIAVSSAGSTARAVTIIQRSCQVTRFEHLRNVSSVQPADAFNTLQPEATNTTRNKRGGAGQWPANAHITGAILEG